MMKMAIFYVRTSIIKASAGKSAVASSAYQSASSLYNERLGQTFQYRNKEEVVFSEVLLPENAPPEYKDREKLWNAVEKSQNKNNSRYARQFVIALPTEWSKEECIEHSREFITSTLTTAGMCVDWSYHDKKDNPHLHIMCTCRGINPDGTWMCMEKKEYVLDENGERVPEIDAKTGEQKIRIHRKNGKEYEEKIWKRVTIQTNQWNSRQFLKDIKRSWADTCNKYLTPDQQIDSRSYVERAINRVPLLHEGPEARAAQARGVEMDVIKENHERRKINQQLAQMEKFITEARKLLEDLKNKLRKWREENEKRRSYRTDGFTERNGAVNAGVSGTIEREHGRTGESNTVQELKDNAQKLVLKTESVRKHHRRR